jgi:hypothetical protein
MNTKRAFFGLVGIAALGFAPAARAQNVEFAATSKGCFYTVVICVPTAVADLFGGAPLGGLTYHGGTFDDFTNGLSPNSLSIGGHVSNFGWFDAGNGVHSPAANQKFLLETTFTTPFLVGSPTVVFHSAVTGGVSMFHGNPIGGYDVGLNADGIQTFQYLGPDFNGTFTIEVESIHATHGGLHQDISGLIVTNATATPEPATVGLFATGLIGLIPLARRRRVQNHVSAV